MKIAICDNNQTDRDNLYSMCQDILAEKHIEVQIYIFSSGQGLLESKVDFDIIFLEVQMCDIDGITIGKRLNKNSLHRIIFMCTSTHYMIDAINQVHAFAFLLKPIIQSELNNQLSEIMKANYRMVENNMLSFEVIIIDQGNIKKEIKQIKVYDILYFECVCRKIKIKLLNKEYFCMGTLKNIKDKMEEYDFVRCHNSYLVNLKHIMHATCKDIK